MPKILHLDTAKDMRGGQWQVILQAKGLRSRGHQQVIASPRDSALLGRAAAEGFDTLPLPTGNAWDFETILLVRRFVRQRAFDIIHAHDGRGQTLAWEVSAGWPVRRIASRRVAFRPNRWVHKLKYNLTCHGIIAVSEFVKNLLVDVGIHAEKIRVIPDGVELPAHLASDEQNRLLRAQWQLGDQDFVLGHMGAFTTEKGQDVLIDAVCSLAETLPGLVLLLAGDGPARRALEQKCKGSGHRNVRFLGYCDDLYGFFSRLDLFIMPSRHEGLGSSVLLAMAHGLPVIASWTGGLSEIVDQGKTGWLVQPDSPSALAQAINHANSVGVLRRAMGAAAREKAKGFTSDILSAKTEAFYHEVLTAGRR